MIVPTGLVGGKIPVYFTSALLAEYEDPDQQRRLVYEGVQLLGQPDDGDTEYMKFRVIEPDKSWVIFNGDGLTYMKPSDY